MSNENNDGDGNGVWIYQSAQLLHEFVFPGYIWEFREIFTKLHIWVKVEY